MCTVVINLKEHSCKDEDKDRLCFKPGMCIDIFEDGHEFTSTELNSPKAYKLLHLPGISKAELKHLLEPEEYLSILTAKPYVYRRRKVAIDLGSLSKEDEIYCSCCENPLDERKTKLAECEVDLTI